MRLVQWLFVVSATLFVFGIGFVVIGARTARDTPVAASPVVAVATIKQIMNGIVQPAAGKVFDAVSSTVTAAGVEEVQPRNDAEWAAVADGGAALAEAGNLLLMEGHAIDRGDWVKMSVALIDAGRQTLKAVEAKDPQAVLDAGSVVYDACDACHQRYQRQ